MIGFVDDTNILAVGASTADNCRVLERAHARCLQWAKKSGMKFAPQKYTLTHFSRRRNTFNMEHPARLGEIVLAPQSSVRILGVILDSKLNWKDYLKHIQGRLPAYQRALAITAASTWGADMATARQVYSAIARPGLTYGAPLFHGPGLSNQRVAKELAKAQHQALRKVTGAYKATRTSRVETDCAIPPIHLYLDNLLANYRLSIPSTIAETIDRARQKIKIALQRRSARRQQAPTRAQEAHV